jgi:alcohol dehydrogenase class IV
MLNKNIAQFPIVYAGAMAGGRIAIGWGAHTTVGNEAKAAGIKKALITTTGLRGTGIVEEIQSILNYHDVSTAIFDKVTSNPKDHEVMAAYKVFKEAQCDGVVSVGGGSSHDCGKGVRTVAANNGTDIADIIGGVVPREKIKPCNIPQISVDTTSGTGAQNTGVGAITHTKLRIKTGAPVPGLVPKIALEDPLLIRCQPQHIAAQTGFDAFCHAFELYISPILSQYSQGIAYHVIKLCAKNLREFAFNRGNHVACENMTWAASMAGALGLGSGSGIGIVHGLSHGFSAIHDVHHGLASAVIAIPAERYNQPVCPQKFAEMAQAMGVDTSGMSEIKASDAWFEEVERLLKDLNIETGNLNMQFGLTKEDCVHIVKNQHTGIFREGNPRGYNYEDCVKLLEDLL